MTIKLKAPTRPSTPSPSLTVPSTSPSTSNPCPIVPSRIVPPRPLYKSTFQVPLLETSSSPYPPHHLSRPLYQNPTTTSTKSKIDKTEIPLHLITLLHGNSTQPDLSSCQRSSSHPHQSTRSNPSILPCEAQLKVPSSSRPNLAKLDNLGEHSGTLRRPQLHNSALKPIIIHMVHRPKISLLPRHAFELPLQFMLHPSGRTNLPIQLTPDGPVNRPQNFRFGHVIPQKTPERTRNHDLRLPRRFSGSITNSQSYEKALQDIQVTLEEFAQAGFILSKEKCHLTPTKSLRHLGMIIDLQTMSFHIPSDKKIDIANLAFTLAKKPVSRIQTLAKLVGKLVSISRAFWPAKRFAWSLIREMVAFPGRIDYSRRISISQAARNDLLHLHKTINRLSSRVFSSDLLPSLIEIQTDASLEGFGGVISQICPRFSKNLLPTIYFQGHWPSDHQSTIATLELATISKAIQLIPPQTHQTQLRIICDNTNSLTYLSKGGKASSLFPEYCRLIDSALYRNLFIQETYWIPSLDNILPDFISRIRKHHNSQHIATLISAFIKSLPRRTPRLLATDIVANGKSSPLLLTRTTTAKSLRTPSSIILFR